MSDAGAPEHPLVDAVRPLAEAIRATIVPPERARSGDVPLCWEGVEVAYVRLPVADGAAGLTRLIGEVSDELGGPLHTLPRTEKQRAVRLLEERGAFEWRRAVETIAESIGVTRFTVYNYLNRDRG
ncbi:helix-turn-helix domain-containing protein [Haloechinothrix sp. YIM 98757]|uniref:Helix-turn-helix domain-containing protein n=1 Tax=Haloechinothrix aidingensis TaxID=2752311 RepID=A0A837ZW08_9PSEU|nr:helix-turn-helix domain-containing protein [Haloechinothrix aidingensis]MBA0124836.1 helix-turn-helix domain-containing protein [Haloechinothrix aidingensis]